MGNSLKSNVLKIGVTHDLRSIVIGFFDINVTTLSDSQRDSLSDFCQWMKQSVVFDDISNSWKYRSMEDGERGSFTFPISGSMSLPHLLHGGDTTVPYLEFDFDAYEKGFLRFISNMNIDYTDESLEYRNTIDNILSGGNEMMLNGDIKGFTGKIQQATEIFLGGYSRSKAFVFLQALGLDYGSDDEGCTTVPIEYIKL